jgi:release factor glutamine methyltransferase
MADVWTVLKILQWTSGHFGDKRVDSPRLTAELLLAHALKISRVQLYVQFDRPLGADELATFRSLVQRRLQGEPTAYLVGQRDFFGRTFRVDARVLVPRPETERLVDWVLGQLPLDAERRVADLCTGSGCIAITLAAERPQARVIATDVSPDALAVAAENVATLGVSDRVELRQGDLFAPLEGQRFDVVVSNPPYIAEAVVKTLSAEVQREPRLALVGGPRGIEIVERIARGAKAHLHPEGVLALEIGDDQGPLARELLTTQGYRSVEVLRDWAGKDRVAVGRA